MENKNLDEIKKTFETKLKKNKVKTIELINDGYTNYVYKITDKNNNKYLMKVSKNNEPIMTNESKIYEKYKPKDLVYSDDHGIIIKKWIDGEEFNILKDKEKRIKALCDEIDKFHNIKFNLKDFQHFDFSEYVEWLARKNKYLEIYNFAIKNNRNARLVLCHGDINNKNVIIINNKKINLSLIDFEWSCINYEWFDYINYIAEQELYDDELLEIFIKKNKILKSISNIYLLLFVRWYYCLAWASLAKNIDNLDQYKKRAKQQVKLLYKKIISNKWYIPIKKINLKF